MDPFYEQRLRDPFYEQRLRNEVIYLHSLWHQGPPRPNPNPINPNQNTPTYLQPSNPTQFKKKKKPIKGKKKLPESNPPPVSNIEWPCPPSPKPNPVTSSGWPVLNLPSTQTTRLPSEEEKSKFIANHIQKKALKASEAFFKSNEESDSDEDEDEDEDEEEYKFLLKLFMDDSELKGYYEKNWERGEFSCLVCCGIRKKVGKKFKDCVALVQHSVSIAKTKKKRAHRAFGKAICEVLGWDIHRLPSIDTSFGNSQNTLTLDDANKLIEDPDKGVSIIAEGNVEGVVVQEALKDNGIESCGNELKDNRKDNVVPDGSKAEDDGNQNMKTQS